MRRIREWLFGARRMEYQGIRTLSVRVLGDARGVIALEAALVFPVFCMLVVGCFDVGMWAVQSTAVQNGLGAGGQYLMQHTSSAGVESIVRASSGLLSSAEVTASGGGSVSLVVSVPFGGTGLLPISSVSASGSYTLKSGS